MKKIIFMLILVFLASPILLAKEMPVIGSFEIVSDSGPLPPEYQWESNLSVYILNKEKFLHVKYRMIDGCYGCSDYTKEQIKINDGMDLKGDWYDDVKKLTDDLRLCDIGKKPKEIMIGGGDKYISIKGRGLEGLIKSGIKPDGGEVIFRECNLCSKNKNWWRDLEVLQGEMAQAVSVSAKKAKPARYRFYQAASKSLPEMVEININPITRSATVRGAAVVKNLNKEEIRKFKELAYDVNYYFDGEIKRESELMKFHAGEIFFDRGDGTFFSFKNGIKDPIGKDGATERLQRFYYHLHGAD